MPMLLLAFGCGALLGLRAMAAERTEVLEAVAANAGLRGTHVVMREVIEPQMKLLHPSWLRDATWAALDSMMAGNGPSFAMLQGECRRLEGLLMT
eukprot:6176577-Pleurochrysis_carterae.AAC.1